VRSQLLHQRQARLYVQWALMQAGLSVEQAFCYIVQIGLSIAINSGWGFADKYHSHA
jgi:hypothetical protein